MLAYSIHYITLFNFSLCFILLFSNQMAMKHSIYIYVVRKVENQLTNEYAWNNEEIKICFPNVRDVILISMNERIKSNSIFTKNLISSCTVYVLFPHHFARSEILHIVWWRAFSGMIWGFGQNCFIIEYIVYSDQWPIFSVQFAVSIRSYDWLIHYNSAFDPVISFWLYSPYSIYYWPRWTRSSTNYLLL